MFKWLEIESVIIIIFKLIYIRRLRRTLIDLMLFNAVKTIDVTGMFF